MTASTRRPGTQLTSLIDNAGDPVLVATGVQLYSKDVAGTKHFFARTSDGTIYQITPPSGGGSTGESGWFGTGFDGDYTTAGSEDQTQDLFYNNLTITAGDVFRTRGYRLFVKGTLTIQPGGFLDNSGEDGAGFLGGAATPTGTVLGGGAGGKGAEDDGPAATPGGNTAWVPDGYGTLTGGDGGNAGPGLGGVSSSTTGWNAQMIHWIATGDSISGGPGGGGGATASGNNGGGAGGGGGCLVVCAKSIVADPGSIRSRGGNGAGGAGTDASGGGGGSGGVILGVTSIDLVLFNAMCVVPGGTGGASGGGTGVAGGNGSSGIAISIQAGGTASFPPPPPPPVFPDITDVAGVLVTIGPAPLAITPTAPGVALQVDTSTSSFVAFIADNGVNNRIHLSASVRFNTGFGFGTIGGGNLLLGNNNNVALGNSANTFFTGAGAATITGIFMDPTGGPNNLFALGTGFILIYNDGPNTITLTDEDPLSLAENRFMLIGGGPVVIPSKGSVIAMHMIPAAFSPNSRWILIGSNLV